MRAWEWVISTVIKTNQYSVTDKIKLRTELEQGNINGSGYRSEIHK